MQIPTVPSSTTLPRELSRFSQLACNLHWTWSAAAQECFALVEPALWAATGNPVDLLQRVPAARPVPLLSWVSPRLNHSYVPTRK